MGGDQSFPNRAAEADRLEVENENLKMYKYKLTLLEEKMNQTREVVARISNLAGIELEFPELPDDSVLAEAGARGVILNTGHLEEDPDKELYLVRFEYPDGVLGPPTGCWPQELKVADTGS